VKKLVYHEGLEILVGFLLLKVPVVIYTALGMCFPSVSSITKTVTDVWVGIGVLCFLLYTSIQILRWWFRVSSDQEYQVNNRNQKRVQAVIGLLIIVTLFSSLGKLNDQLRMTNDESAMFYIKPLQGESK
jgi:hypothetical protein